MKNNMKKTVGVSALGLALVSSLSLGAFAANAGEIPVAETDAAKTLTVASDSMDQKQNAGQSSSVLISRYEGETDKVLISTDGGVTWEEVDPNEVNPHIDPELRETTMDDVITPG